MSSTRENSVLSAGSFLTMTIRRQDSHGCGFCLKVDQIRSRLLLQKEHVFLG